MDSVSRANGGIFEAERRLQQSLQGLAGVRVQVVGLLDAQTDSDRTGWVPLHPLTHRVLGPQAFGYAPLLFNTLLKADADLAYCAGLWKYPSLAALRWARRTGRPMVVAPHGMLDQWAVQNSRLKKQLAGWAFQNQQLQRAACIRALCDDEARAIRAYGLKNPIAIVPNGIDLPSASPGLPAPWDGQSDNRRVLLFLGRIHPKKGLVNLFQAWAAVRPANWLLAIAGWDQGGHEAELQRLATELGIPWADVRQTPLSPPRSGAPASGPADGASLLFLGPQFNEAKAACYARCNAFILPSFSEGLPMAILEAWAYGKPAMMTPECNLPEGFQSSAALRVQPDANDIARGLRQLIEMSDDEQRQMGSQGLALIQEKFTWPKVAAKMRSVYEWVLGGGSPPPCMICD